MARTLQLHRPPTGGAIPQVFAFLGGPVSWTLHLLLMYFILSNFCGVGTISMRVILAAVTAVLALVAFSAAAVGWREWKPDPGRKHRTLDEPVSRSSFMGRSGVMLGILFGVATIAEGIPIALLHTC